MKQRFLKIGRWSVDFLFFKRRYNKKKVLSMLEDMGASDDVLFMTEDLIDSDMLNTGFTCSNIKTRRALVVIGPTTSGAEFLDTFTHEIHHLAVAIADSLGVDLEGEMPAYISGDTARDLIDVVCKLGCGCES